MAKIMGFCWSGTMRARLSLKSMKPAKQIPGAGTRTNTHRHTKAPKNNVFVFGHGCHGCAFAGCRIWLAQDCFGRKIPFPPGWIGCRCMRKNLWHALTKLHQKFTAHDTVPPPHETAFVKHKIPWGRDPWICRSINRKNRCFPTPCFTERAWIGAATKLIKPCYLAQKNYRI